MSQDTPLLIEPESLQALLGSDRLVIVDLSSIENFNAGHIPGSQHLDFKAIISGQAPAAGKTPSATVISKVLNALGITPNSWVVALDDEGGGWAGRFLWTLKLVGLTNYSYLNGGLVSWVNEGFPVTQNRFSAKAANESYHFDSDEHVQADMLIEGFHSGAELQVWDARSAEEHAGIRQNAARAGHMPGAINIDWLELMDRERNLRLREDLAEFVQSRGIKLEKPTVTHCQSHHRSGLTWLAGQILGMNIKAYDGSWSEWGNREDTQVEV